jgi:Fe-S-cluster containining protein
MVETPWYRNGLRFTCARCGRCCGGGPGTIRASDDEIAALATGLGVDEQAFRERYTRRLRRGEVSLIEKDNHDCIFYDRERACTVYENRPRQCRTWPFWRANLVSPDHWGEEAERCRGMNAGHIHRAEEIAAMALDDGTSASRRRRTAASPSGGKAAHSVPAGGDPA